MHSVPNWLDETYHGHVGSDHTVNQALYNRENLVLSLVVDTRITRILIWADIFIGVWTRMLNPVLF